MFIHSLCLPSRSPLLLMSCMAAVTIPQANSHSMYITCRVTVKAWPYGCQCPFYLFMETNCNFSVPHSCVFQAWKRGHVLDSMMYLLHGAWVQCWLSHVICGWLDSSNFHGHETLHGAYYLSSQWSEGTVEESSYMPKNNCKFDSSGVLITVCAWWDVIYIPLCPMIRVSS